MSWIDRIVAPWVAVVPAVLQPAYQQHRLLTVLTRLRWLFFAGIFFQVVQFTTDWLRYRERGQFEAPAHAFLFYIHVASTGLIIMYGLAVRQMGAVQHGQLRAAERWVLLINIVFTAYGLLRAALTYWDRQTVTLYVLFLLISQLLFLNDHRRRLLLVAVSLGVMVPVAWLTRTGTPAQQYTKLVEVILFTLGIAGVGNYLYNVFVREFVQNRQIEAQNKTLAEQAKQLANKQQRSVRELEQRSQELISYVLREQRHNAFLLQLREKIATASSDRLTYLIDSQLNQEERWQYFVVLFERLYPLFFARLQAAYPALNTSDLRLVALLKLNLSTKEISTLLGISPQSTNTARYRLRKRLDLHPDASLEAFLQQY